MSKKIEAIVSQCMDCQRYLPSQADKPTIPLMATRPMEVLDSDCLNLMANTMLSSVTGSRAIYGLRGKATRPQHPLLKYLGEFVGSMAIQMYYTLIQDLAI